MHVPSQPPVPVTGTETRSACAVRIKSEQDELTTDQSAERQQHIADALATLREAIAAGWKDFAHLQKDPDLIPLRDLPEFQELIKPR